MHDATRAARPEPRSADERQAASLLVRCWLEPNESPDATPVLRGYVRNLKTGEERFIKDLESIGHQILRQLAPEAADDAAPQRQAFASRALGRSS